MSSRKEITLSVVIDYTLRAARNKQPVITTKDARRANIVVTY